MNIFVSHPTGNRNSRSLLSSFYENQILVGFGTTISVRPDSFWLSLLPSSIKSELLRRSFDLPPQLIWTHPLRELIRMISNKLDWKGLIRHETGFASVDTVYQNFDTAFANKIVAQTRKKKIDAVYCYEDGALQTFSKAKQFGLSCIYDLPIAYWQTSKALLMIEAERMPAWRKTLGGGIENSEKKLERKTRELELADVIITPGQFVIDSIPEWAKEKKIILSPFGSPDVIQPIHLDRIATSPLPKRPLRILFAGSMSQRKGLGDLMRAMRLIKSKHVELIIMGSLLDSMDFYRSQFAGFTYKPGRPHQEVLALMRSCDVFCLPSIVEGRALVMQEAMSQGLPLLITANTGGADLIIEGQTGFLIAIQSPEQIAQKIDWFASHPQETKQMKQAAQAHAALYTWREYAQKIVNELQVYLERK